MQIMQQIFKMHYTHINLIKHPYRVFWVLCSVQWSEESEPLGPVDAVLVRPLVVSGSN